MCAFSSAKWHACGERRLDAGRVRGGSPAVVVVGGGVSGCACAAVLASRGVRVTVLNAALDAVGLPGYGPDLVAGTGGWDEIADTMEALPKPLRWAWLNAASVPANGAPLLCVDRRAVSIETKRALERIPGLHFRQGLVSDIRALPEADRWRGGLEQGTVAVETVFGEVFEADAIVLAVGLGLGGVVTVGGDTLPGGRYGDIQAGGLREALEAMGASFCETRVEVGPRFSSHGGTVTDALPGSGIGRLAAATVPARRMLPDSGRSPVIGGASGVDPAKRVPGEDLNPEDHEDGAGGESGRSVVWPQGYPPAVHWVESLRSCEMILGAKDGGPAMPLLSPDGIATSEVHLAPAGAFLAGLGSGGSGGASTVNGIPASRLGHTIQALRVTSLTAGGRLAVDRREGPWIWVSGRAAGAAGYLESLRSGVSVALEVAWALADRESEHEQGDCNHYCGVSRPANECPPGERTPCRRVSEGAAE